MISRTWQYDTRESHQGCMLEEIVHGTLCGEQQFPESQGHPHCHSFKKEVKCKTNAFLHTCKGWFAAYEAGLS